MTIKKTAGFLLVILSSALLSLGLFSGLSKGNSGLLFNKGDSYTALWKRVDSCEKKGLTESALKTYSAQRMKTGTDFVFCINCNACVLNSVLYNE